MSDRAYDILKWIAQIALPAIATCYFTLAQLWHWPNADLVVGTITAVDALLGCLLGISTEIYKNKKEGEENDKG